MKPLLRSVGSLLISGDVCFQLGDPIFGCAQLMRKFLSRLQCGSAVFFRNAGRSVEQLQNRLACFVELIGNVNRRAFRTLRKRDHMRVTRRTISLTVQH